MFGLTHTKSIFSCVIFSLFLSLWQQKKSTKRSLKLFPFSIYCYMWNPSFSCCSFLLSSVVLLLLYFAFVFLSSLLLFNLLCFASFFFLVFYYFICSVFFFFLSLFYLLYFAFFFLPFIILFVVFCFLFLPFLLLFHVCCVFFLFFLSCIISCLLFWFPYLPFLFFFLCFLSCVFPVFLLLLRSFYACRGFFLLSQVLFYDYSMRRSGRLQVKHSPSPTCHSLAFTPVALKLKPPTSLLISRSPSHHADIPHANTYTARRENSPNNNHSP